MQDLSLLMLNHKTKEWINKGKTPPQRNKRNKKRKEPKSKTKDHMLKLKTHNEEPKKKTLV
jgi:hypothetical protein